MINLDANYWFLKYTETDDYNNYFFIKVPSQLNEVKEGISYIANSFFRLLFDETYSETDVIFEMKEADVSTIIPSYIKNLFLSSPESWGICDPSGSINKYNETPMTLNLLGYRNNTLSSLMPITDTEFDDLVIIDKLIYIYLQIVMNNDFSKYLSNFENIVDNITDEVEYLFSIYISNVVINLKKDSNVY